MTLLTCKVLDARPASQAAAPAIVFRLRIETLDGGRIHALALRCQTRIEPRGRRYGTDEQALLYELFGEPSMWDRSLRGVTWAHSAAIVPAFDRSTEIDLVVPCTYDLEVAGAKYLNAIREGEVPLAFLFSGTIFREAGDSGDPGRSNLAIEPVPWSVEATFRMPATVWRGAMDQFFPGGGWLRLRRETIDRLQAFRGRQALLSWDEAIARLLEPAVSRESV
jgi:hypothetical protein